MVRNLLLAFLSLILTISCTKETTQTSSNSAYSDTESWMHDLIIQYPSKDIALKDILIPGAHDAGMYELNLCYGGNSCNTQTQSLAFKEQLLQGMRIFDVRPSVADGKFYTEHSTGCGGYGCKGALMETIFKDIRSFLDTHAELVILEISHFCGSSASDTAFLNMADRLLGERIYKEITPSSVPYYKQPLKDIIGSNTSGKVLMLYEGVSNIPSNRSKGLFSGDILPREGAWTDSHDLADMLSGQLQQYRNFSNDGEHLFQFSWQITLDEVQSINCVLYPDSPSIQIEADSAHAALPAVFDSLIAVNQIQKGRIPNILYLDFSQSNLARQCIRINKLNLE